MSGIYKSGRPVAPTSAEVRRLMERVAALEDRERLRAAELEALREELARLRAERRWERVE